MLSVAALLTT